MKSKDISEEKLNLFIDGQLDIDEMNEIRQAVLDDKELRERVCQLNAVRELVGYAYKEVPRSPSATHEGAHMNTAPVQATLYRLKIHFSTLPAMPALIINNARLFYILIPMTVMSSTRRSMKLIF